MITCDTFKDYILLDAGDREKLESWKGVILCRPDPMAIWPKTKPELWDDWEAFYHRSKSGGGHWEYRKKPEDHWTVSFEDLTFRVSPTDFKHTGLFPEQASNWKLIGELIRNSGRKDLKILNLFAYSGAATVAASKAGAKEVVHVDAAKGMVSWAKENAELSGVGNNLIRYIVEDCLKFMQREIRRGRKYDGIIMDPPSYGRGPNNELFRFEEQINPLLEAAEALLSDEALFLIVNTYTTGYSPEAMRNLLTSHIQREGRIESDEIGIPLKDSAYVLPCGQCSRWIR